MNKVSLASIVAAILLAAVPVSAEAAPNPVDMEFSRSKPHDDHDNNVARFTGQVDYSTGTFAWSLKLEPAARRSCTDR